MSDLIRRNFEPGRWLLVSGVVLSFVLMLQLYAINEMVDISSIDSIVGGNYIGLFLITSYLLTTVVMIMVVIEYFNVKKKVDGLLALTEVLSLLEDLQYPAKPSEPSAEDVQLVRPLSYSLDEEDTLFEPETLNESKTLDPLEQAFALDDEEEVPGLVPETVTPDLDSHETIEEKKMEALTDGAMEKRAEEEVIEQVAYQEDLEEDEVEDMLQQSEVISTLTELERVVEELKTKKPKIAAA